MGQAYDVTRMWLARHPLLKPFLLRQVLSDLGMALTQRNYRLLGDCLRKEGFEPLKQRRIDGRRERPWGRLGLEPRGRPGEFDPG